MCQHPGSKQVLTQPGLYWHRVCTAGFASRFSRELRGAGCAPDSLFSHRGRRRLQDPRLRLCGRAGAVNPCLQRV